MKPFDLEKAKAGEPVQTKNGFPVKILFFDAKNDYPIVALITNQAGEDLVESYTLQGTFYETSESDQDLRMVSKVWKPKVDIAIFREKLQTNYWLLAYVYEFYGTYEFKPAEANGYVYYSNARKMWKAAVATTTYTPGVIYMPPKIAEELAAKLKRGEVIL